MSVVVAFSYPVRRGITGSDNEEVTSRAPIYSSFNEKRDFSNPVPQFGMEFESLAQFRWFIRHDGCLKGYDFV